MRSSLYFLLLLLLFPFSELYSQADLPSGFNFDETTPVGWTEDLGTNGLTRYSSGQVGQSCRFDATNENVVVFFAEEPGMLSYYMKGWNTGGSWQGTFTVEESVNGISYTALRTFNTGELPSSGYNLFTDAPAPNTRYIRWNFTNKVAGHNVGLDEVLLEGTGGTSIQEISVLLNNENIGIGTSISIGNQTLNSLVVRNIGISQSLALTSLTISGINATDFSVNFVPSAVSALGEINFQLTFSY